MCVRSWSVYGEKLSTFSARGVVRSVVLKNSDRMSPTSPCCKQGLISAFIHSTSVLGVCVCVCPLKCSKFVLFSTCFCVCVLHACTCALFHAPCCSAVQYLSSVCREDRLEDDLRINAILKQNATCLIFTPSLPPGERMGWFSWRRVNLSTLNQKQDRTAAVYSNTQLWLGLPKHISFSAHHAYDKEEEQEKW